MSYDMENMRAVDRDGTLYVCSTDVVYIGDLGGIQWKSSRPGRDSGTSSFDCEFLASTHHVIYVMGTAGAKHVLFRSADEGKSWARVEQANVSESPVAKGYGPLIGQQGVLYLAGFRSVDGGANWRPYRFGVPNDWELHIGTPPVESRLLVMSDSRSSAAPLYLSVDGKAAKEVPLASDAQYKQGEDGAVYAIVHDALDLYKSSDDGRTWTQVDRRAVVW